MFATPSPLPLLVAFALGLSLPGQGEEAQGGTPRVLLERLDGTTEEVELTSFRLSDPRDRGAFWVRPVGFPQLADSEAEPSGPAIRIRLAGGDEVLGRVAGGAGEDLTLELLGGVRFPVGISKMEILVLPDHVPADRLVPMQAPDEGDRLYRRIGDKLDAIDGTVEEFDDEGIRFDSLLGSRLFPWAEIAALFIEVLEEPGDEPLAEGTPVVLDLADGGRLRASLLGIEGRACRLVAAGSTIRLDLAHVSEISVDDGSFAFLSDVAPEREEGKGVPFGDELGMSWPHHLDASVTGAPLSTGGREWRRGIGMHAPTRVTWTVPDGFQTLRGALGIDDSALVNPEPARGSVVFRVLLDGEEAWSSPVVRGGDGALPMPAVPLGDATELTLEVDPAGDFRGDRANWLRVVLVR